MIRWFSAISALALLGLVGCAQQAEVRPPITIAERPEPEVTLESAPLPEATVESRPRLSKTITLGAGTDDQYTMAGERAVTPTTGANGTNIVINNNVIVSGQPGYGGYYGGYAYGGYGYGGRGYGARGAMREGSGRSSFSGAWAPTGWEGAQRTAAPGRTPGVGGNWAPAPSYGPATMK